jgi:hypothetical protein
MNQINVRPQQAIQNKWHETHWTEHHLVNTFGFKVSSRSTIVAVDEGNRELDIQYVYCKMPETAKMTAMAKLSDYVFTKQGKVKTQARDKRGNWVVNKRGGKAMSYGMVSVCLCVCSMGLYLTCECVCR